MADAVVTSLRDSQTRPNDPAYKPTKALRITFDATGVQSTVIDKDRFTVCDFATTVAFTTATQATFKVGHQKSDAANFPVLDGVVFDLTKRTFNTSLLAGYPFIIIVLDQAEAKSIDMGLI